MLLLTVLIVDRVARIRQMRGQSRAIAAQAAIIVAQGVGAQLFRAIQAGGTATSSVDDPLDQLRAAAAPLLSVLDREQRAAVSAGDVA